MACNGSASAIPVSGSDCSSVSVCVSELLVFESIVSGSVLVVFGAGSLAVSLSLVSVVLFCISESVVCVLPLASESVCVVSTEVLAADVLSISDEAAGLTA